MSFFQGDMNSSSIKANSSRDDYWGRYAHTYDDDTDYVVGRLLRRSIYKRLSRERNLDYTLECGCGTGFYTRAISGQATRIMATDLSAEMLAAAKERLRDMSHVSFQQIDCEAHVFPPTSFETVLMANILNTLSQPLKALREAYCVLKYDGALIAVTYTDYNLDAFEKIEIGKRYFEKFGLPPSGGLINYSPKQMEVLIKKAGFEIKTMDVLGDKAKAIYVRAAKTVPPP
jgi:ubiquinone/menaquinone biosynthesis C-methylase UbiE